ncbi:nucleotidyltransferase domain-containing protein [bacterium]|nr:nucleotidyltransferase domain-containing protein [bacterium]
MEINLAIKKTIKYAQSFGGNLNKDEIEERLISKKIFSEREIEKVIKKIVDKNKVDRWYLEKYEKAMEFAKEIEGRFNNILFLGVSGSVASGHPKKNDDIDFLVITKNNKLWKNRFFLRWWMFKKQIPHRKYGEKEKKDEFCFNLWLDTNSLLLPKNKQNLRNAVDLVLLKPLINKNKTYEKFVLINAWAKKWVATPYQNKISNFQFPISKKNKKNNKLEEISNYLYFWPQYWYMKRKIQGEKIGLHEAFFHRRMVK